MKRSAPKQQSKAPSPGLDQLLQRDDIWRGHSQRFSNRESVDTGFPLLNQYLLNTGWPCNSLIELCQASAGSGDWLLFSPAMKTLLTEHRGHAVLLNPPSLPFAQGLMQAGIPLQQLLVVHTTNKADFVVSFVELARASCCSLLLAWQPKQALTYTELRKCQLACSDNNGLYCIFRPLQVQQQSSPAALRLKVALSQNALDVFILKQQGQLRSQAETPIQLALPQQWQALQAHRKLGDDDLLSPAAANDQAFTHYQPRQNILSMGLRTQNGKKIKLKRHY
ncbi:hypothetical protein SAMN02745866_00400 [Alteromonadaceae bacterium Bs31]|nr:hypothetical protein SAMN02745866_00400 [Alteromonadaceae bacterium Bs31]